MFQWIRRLFSRIFADTRPPYVPGFEPFPVLNTEKVRNRLQPEERGRKAGQNNLPPSGAQSVDANELEIESFFSGELTTSARICDGQLKGYEQSIQALGPANTAAAVDRIKGTAVGDLRTLARSGSNQLHTTAERARELSRDFDAFKAEHRLTRAPVYPESRIYHWGFLAVLLVAETVINGYMFSRGSQFGLLGGALEAVFFAVGNLSVGAFVGGGLVLPLLYCRRWFRRFILGVPVAVGFLVLSAAYNLAVAHYRDALSQPQQNAAALALSSLASAPFALSDLLGWLLLCAGFAFCIGAALDWFRMDDPYPGYGKLHRLATQGKEDYADKVDSVYGEARQVREQAFTSLGMLSRGVAINQQQRHVLHDRSQHLVVQMRQHYDYLQTCFRTLISEYRSANSVSRTTPDPAFFATSPSLKIVPLPGVSPLSDESNLDGVFAAAQPEIDLAYQQTIMAFDTVRVLTEERHDSISERT